MNSILTNMFNDFTLLSSVQIIALIGLCWLTLHFYTQQKHFKNQLRQLQNEVRAINSGNLGMGRKINQFAEEIAQVEMTQQVAEPSSVNNKSYQQAGLLLSRGATIEEVVESCEIAPAEAELLAIMKHSSAQKVAMV